MTTTKHRATVLFFLIVLAAVPLLAKKKTLPVKKAKAVPPKAVMMTAPDAPTEIRRMADATGFNQLSKVHAVRFTYDVRLAVVPVKRSWIWEPDSDRVTCRWRMWGFIPRTRTYLRNSMRSGDIKIDKWFANDRNWLMFPFQLMWDKNIKVTYQGISPLPLMNGTARLITVTYSKEGGGYNPGDVYDVYYGEDYLIKQWTYHKGGEAEATLTTTWDSYVKVGPLVFSTDHEDDDHTFHLTFEDLGVKMSGDKDWRLPGPLK